MPGMTRSLGGNNPTMISAFHTALIHQLLVIGLFVVVAVVAWNVLRTLQLRRVMSEGAPTVEPTAPPEPEAVARRVLRISFGLLWVLDGLLQAQSGMVLGMPTTVLRPAGTGSPGWVQHLVHVAVATWSNHPIDAAASAVWIQLGVGIFILFAPQGRWSRASGVVSVGWAAVVWVFGEGFGAIFAPGLTWAFGAPGAVAFYGVAGVLLALPTRAWWGPRLGRWLNVGMGAFFCGMAVLQAWPGRGFWQGRTGHGGGVLAGMAASMAETPQPRLFSGWVSSFASFDAAHGWGVNLFLVVALGAIGIALCTGRPRPVVVATVCAGVLCLATWVLVEDLGFFGGVGTDPNSMVPMLLLIVTGAIALVRYPTGATVEAPEVVASEPSRAVPWWEQLRPAYAGRALAALVAVAVVLVGAIPMAAASANPNADPILTQAVDGSPNAVDAPAPGFALTDQRGRPVSLASLRGKVVALTFLDPVCTTDCPLIAQEFRQADAMLGSDSDKVTFVAVVANPIYRSLADVQAFDRDEGMRHMANWLFLTGSVRELARTWNAYGVQVAVVRAGGMVAHGDIVYVVDAHGHERTILDADPGTDSYTYSSFSSELTDQLQSVLRS